MEMPVQPFDSLFDDPAAWRLFASGQATGRISSITDSDDQPGLRLEYDFHRGGAPSDVEAIKLVSA